MPDPTKVTINLTSRAAAALEELSSDGTKTTAINRSILLYAWVRGQLEAGGQMQVVAADGTTTEVKLF